MMTYGELMKRLADENIAMGVGRLAGGLVHQPLQDLMQQKTFNGYGASTVEAVNDALERLYQERHRLMN